MLYRLPLDTLCQGMFIVDISVHWHKHDKLYSNEGWILSIEQLEAIQNSGCTAAYVDLNRSKPGTLPPGLTDFLAPFRHNPFQMTSIAQKSDFDDECIVANTLYTDSLKLAREIEQEARQGEINIKGARPFIESINQSLDRNYDALIGLSKLRQNDEYTYTHCVNVTIFSVLFAKALGASEETTLYAGLGALFHDIGKYYISSEIINAPRKLTSEEFAIIKQHPELGAKLLEKIEKTDSRISLIARDHHEKYNGAGYPNGLSGGDISTEAALVGIVDVFDALTSARAYKQAFPLSQALSIIYSQRGESFTPILVDQFIRQLGVFPLGTVVRLNDNRVGIVCQTSQLGALRPKVKILFDRRGRRILAEEVDLSADSALKIETALAPHTLGINPAAELNLPQ